MVDESEFCAVAAYIGEPADWPCADTYAEIVMENDGDVTPMAFATVMAEHLQEEMSNGSDSEDDSESDSEDDSESDSEDDSESDSEDDSDWETDLDSD